VDVGNVSTLTGPVPGRFIGAVHGINAFAAYLNSVGGVCGRKFVVKAADDNFSPSGNASAIQSLAPSVLAFVGSFSAFDDGGAQAIQSSGVSDIGEAESYARFALPENFSPQPNPVGVNLAPWIYLKQRFPSASQHMANLIENASNAVSFGQGI
jgi:hypothetical protein